MALKIQWSDEAKQKLIGIFHYLEQNWSLREQRQFASLLEMQLKRISQQPKLYKRSNRLYGVRECPITKHNSLFYNYDSRNLHVITLWDNRQDPKKLNL